MSQHNDDGQKAEAAVADYLEQQGYKILDRNWKTRQCEVDVIARKGDAVHFVEVKYRSKPDQGTGFEYITRTKLQQMSFAANYWVAQNNWGGEYVLSGASVAGPAFAINFIEQI